MQSSAAGSTSEDAGIILAFPDQAKRQRRLVDGVAVILTNFAEGLDTDEGFCGGRSYGQSLAQR